MKFEAVEAGRVDVRDLGIVTVNYRTASEVEGLALSVPSSLSRRLAVFCVVDNSDAPEQFDGAAQVFEGTDVAFVVLRPGRNIGFGAANNLGLRYVESRRCRAVWFLNPDSRILTADPRGIDEALSMFPSATIFATGLDTGVGERPGTSLLGLWSGRVLPARRSSHGLQFVNGNSMVARVRSLVEAGGFDERFFLYFEEADLAVRCAPRGTPVAVEGLVITHIGGVSTGSRRGELRSPVAIFHAHRSSVLFFAKHLPRHLVPLLIARLGNCGRLALHGPSLGWAAFRGLASGVGLALREGIGHD